MGAQETIGKLRVIRFNLIIKKLRENFTYVSHT